MTMFVGPLFLVGMPRSGTKLLRTIINNHSAISILEVETEFLPYWALHWDRFGDLSKWRNFLLFYGRVQNSPYVVLHRSEVGPPIEAKTWYESCRDFSAAGVFEALVRHDAGVPFGADVIWGDKSPSYVRSLPLLKQLYPQARVVHITRDVRDYCLSLNKALAKDMSRAAQRWADDIKSAQRTGQRLGHDYLEVRYEDLIADPSSVAGRICAFVGREFQPTMTTLAKPAEQPFEALGGAGSGLRIILGDNTNKWRSEGSPHVDAYRDDCIRDAAPVQLSHHHRHRPAASFSTLPGRAAGVGRTAPLQKLPPIRSPHHAPFFLERISDREPVPETLATEAPAGVC